MESVMYMISSQTDFPKEKYPTLFDMGEKSIEHRHWIWVLKAFAEEELHCRVTDQDVESISLRGFYRYGERGKEIVLNHLLNDTEKLSTLSHEIGHAVTFLKEMESAEAELRADMISMMLQWNMGIEVTDSRKKHFQEHYRKVWNKFGENASNKMDQLLDQVFQTYKHMNEKLKLYQSMSKKMERKVSVYGKEY
ncbi:MAG: ImmA/IrrE family metallo-endopeptidase [Sellimonas intestinalis]